MRICLLGHLTDQPDEGVRSVVAHLASALRDRHEIELLPVHSPATWRRIRQFSPDIIHFVLSPTGAGLLVAKALSLAHRYARTVVSAPHPSFEVFSRWMPFKPDVILAQALDSERRFRRCGYRTLFLPNGVDTDRFVPVSRETKRRLRNQYGIGNQFVILHVGPLKQGRNVQVMGRLQGNNRQALIVGRASDPDEKSIVEELRGKGGLVWSKYFKDIHEIYTLSDCYVFPTVEKKSCVEMPLSVLEAMACNLPVISTPFGALPRVIDEGEGVVYAHTIKEFDQAITRLESNGVVVNTRRKVLSLSWADVARQLEHIYEQLLW
jgi:glycosyltransferase involved in cell wall biosynthesis